MANNNDYDYDVTKLTPYPKTSPVFWNNIREKVHNIVGHVDNRLNAIIEVTSFTYSSSANEATFSGFAFVNGEFVTYVDETVTAQNNEYVFATGTLVTPSLTASANMYDVDGALIGQVTDTDTATAMYNKRDLTGGEYIQYINEIYRFRGPKTYYTNAHDLIAEDTLSIDVTGALDIDSDSTIVIGGTTITITSDAATTEINLNGNVDISETLDVTGLTTLSELTIGSIGLEDTGSSNITSGASLVGIYDEFNHSSGTTVQDVIDDIDNTLYGLHTTIGLKDLTSDEVDQLENIGSATISNTQWGYLGALNQSLTTSSSVQFSSTNANTVSIDGTSLESSSGNTSSGAYKIGVYDEFTHSSSTNVQAVLNDLDNQLPTVKTLTMYGSDRGAWSWIGTDQYLKTTTTNQTHYIYIDLDNKADSVKVWCYLQASGITTSEWARVTISLQKKANDGSWSTVDTDYLQLINSGGSTSGIITLSIGTVSDDDSFRISAVGTTSGTVSFEDARVASISLSY